MINLSKRDRAKRDFTSPPQCPIILSCGARVSKSSAKRGLSQVVISTCDAANCLRRRGVISGDPSLCQWKRRDNRRCKAGGKNEPKSSRPAHTTSFRRCMPAQFSILGAIFSFFYYLLASLFCDNKV